MRTWRAGLPLVACAVLVAGPGRIATAGGFFFKKSDCCEKCQQCQQCEEPEKPKHRCCLFPPDPPRARVAFAMPVVPTTGLAADVDRDTLNRALNRSATQPGTKSATETDADRLDRLEREMVELRGATQAILKSIESLDNRVSKLAPK